MIRKFLNYVEIRTKITSLFPFLMTIAFLLYNKETIDWQATLVFFASMFLFDLTTTAINNYIDTKTNGEVLQFKRHTALMIIVVLLAISSILGLYLAYLTDVVILMIGGLCFLCGIFYTYGPVPISRQPLGEILSGVFYGLLIPFILLHINSLEGTFVTLSLSLETISLSLKVVPIITVLIFSIIPVCATANIMLANNICDLEKDILVKRHTLPYYLGSRALHLFAGLYYLTYVAVIVMVVLKILHPICLITLLTLFVVQKNIKVFLKVQDKEITFLTAIKNYMIIMGVHTLMIFISILFS